MDFYLTSLPLVSTPSVLPVEWYFHPLIKKNSRIIQIVILIILPAFYFFVNPYHLIDTIQIFFHCILELSHSCSLTLYHNNLLSSIFLPWNLTICPSYMLHIASSYINNSWLYITIYMLFHLLIMSLNLLPEVGLSFMCIMKIGFNNLLNIWVPIIRNFKLALGRHNIIFKYCLFIYLTNIYWLSTLGQSL